MCACMRVSTLAHFCIHPRLFRQVFEQFTKAQTASERDEAAALVDTAVTEVLGIPPEARAGGAVGRCAPPAKTILSVYLGIFGGSTFVYECLPVSFFFLIIFRKLCKYLEQNTHTGIHAYGYTRKHT